MLTSSAVLPCPFCRHSSPLLEFGNHLGRHCRGSDWLCPCGFEGPRAAMTAHCLLLAHNPRLICPPTSDQEFLQLLVEIHGKLLHYQGGSLQEGDVLSRFQIGRRDKTEEPKRRWIHEREAAFSVLEGSAGLRKPKFKIGNRCLAKEAAFETLEALNEVKRAQKPKRRKRKSVAPLPVASSVPPSDVAHSQADVASSVPEIDVAYSESEVANEEPQSVASLQETSSSEALSDPILENDYELIESAPKGPVIVIAEELTEEERLTRIFGKFLGVKVGKNAGPKKRGRPRKDESGYLRRCEKCVADFVVRGCEAALDHLGSKTHLGRDELWWQCRLCLHRFASLAAIRSHIGRTHGLEGAAMCREAHLTEQTETLLTELRTSFPPPFISTGIFHQFLAKFRAEPTLT